MESGIANGTARWELFAAPAGDSPLASRMAVGSVIGAAAIVLGAVIARLDAGVGGLHGTELATPEVMPATWNELIDAPVWAQRLLPATLRETGLYADWRSARVTADAQPFTPQYPLWSDGASKRRWIYLPGPIDTSDPDNWQFPVGTRLWKEFSFGARVETRFMIRARDGWKFATYAWTPDGAHAIRASSSGADSTQLIGGSHARGSHGADSRQLIGGSHARGSHGADRRQVVNGSHANGSRLHRIPSTADCTACHENGKTPVLGFSALQLSTDRDPNAVHRETTPGIDLAWLAARGLVGGAYEWTRDRGVGTPARGSFDGERVGSAPRIAGDATQRAALGYLHGNCGGCHRADGPLAGLGMTLDGSDATIRTTIGVPSKYGAPALRIAPGNSAASVLLARMASRHSTAQMPPIGTVVVDAEALRIIADWIDQSRTNY